MNFKKIPFFLSIIILIWPCIFVYTSPANNSIITFILYMSDIVTITNKNRKMVYNEYKLIKGTEPTTIKHHLWLISIIILKIVQTNCYWVLIMSIHIYSPIFNTKITRRLFMIYTSIILYILLEGIYQRIYKKWVITYNVVSTNDTELPLTIT